MSLFEDIIEVHYNANERVEGPRTVGTIERAIDENIHDADDLSVVMDWDTCHYIEDSLMDIELDLDLPESHLETSTKRIGRAVGGKTIVMGTDSGQSFGLALHPIGVNYNNEVIAPTSVIAIDFTD